MSDEWTVWFRDVPADVMDKLDVYRKLLVEWNERMNLTAITEHKEVYIKHFWDSLSVRTLPEWQGVVHGGGPVLDVGTGAGFPGLPLAIAEPDVSFVLCDSLNKRVQFLQHVIQTLGLKNVTAIHGRAEDLAHTPEYRGHFAAVVSRAVARLNVLLEYTCPFLRAGGLLFAYKGPNVDEELSDGTRAAKTLRAKLSRQQAVVLPEGMGDRVLVLAEQVQVSPKGYPRKPAVIKKQPL